jgi:uncharacterized cupredoxin-like copper-binding protein
MVIQVTLEKEIEMFAFKKVLVVLALSGLLLTACGGSKTSEVKITLSEFGIESSTTDFQKGVPYHFVVTNEGTVEHEMMVMPPVMSDSMGMAMDMGEMDKMALVMIEASDLPAGATASFDYTFRELAPDGSLEFACHTPGHYEAGMKLPISVN